MKKTEPDSKQFSILNSQFSILQRGSALIITMLVVAAISTAAFGISRIFLADVRVAASLENALKSYYSAEAGVEEGLVRYRIDRGDDTLNNVTNSLSRPVGQQGRYDLTTTYLTSGNLTAGRIGGAYAFDTIGEYPENPEFAGPPIGAVRQDETVEVATPTAETVTVHWRWQGGVGPANRECGVEITTLRPDGQFNKILNRNTDDVNRENIVYSGATALRVKPLCRSLDWLAFSGGGPIGRTVQTIEATGFAGSAKRKLQSIVNRRSGSLVGIFDFVLGSEEDLIKP